VYFSRTLRDLDKGVVSAIQDFITEYSVTVDQSLQRNAVIIADHDRMARQRLSITGTALKFRELCPISGDSTS
jgi:glycyl-tRNA synthetase (class II)